MSLLLSRSFFCPRIASIDRVPTIHEGCAARGIKERGELSDRIEENVRIKKFNIRIRRMESYGKSEPVKKKRVSKKKITPAKPDTRVSLKERLKEASLEAERHNTGIEVEREMGIRRPLKRSVDIDR